MSVPLTVPPDSCRFCPPVLLLLCGIALFGLGCGDDGGTGLPAPGGIDIAVVTGGLEPDPDGYIILVDDWSGGAIGVNGSRYYDEIEPGTHTVLLDGLAPNCTVAGDNPRTVTVGAGESVTVTFQVTCRATTGSLRLTTATIGPSPDPDGFSVTLDGSEWGVIGANSAVTIPTLAPGTHQAGLSGVAANCTVDGENPRAVTIVAGEEVQVGFAVTCVPPPPGTGTLRITTVTTGADRDPNGYTLTMDGGASQPIGRAATVTLTTVNAGAHAVALGDVAANCTVAGDNPRGVTVVANTTAEATFVVSCASTRGTLAVITATTGADLDPDGYRVRVGDSTGQPIGVADTVTIPNLTAGAHAVRLVNVAANCTVAGENPRTVTITAASTAEVSFVVTCALKTGALEVATITTGTEPDPDGYLVALGQAIPVPVAATGSHTFEQVPAGTHQVELTGMSPNCQAEGQNPRSVSVIAGDTAHTTFTVICGAGALQWTRIPLPQGFEAERGLWASGLSDVFVTGSYSNSTDHLILHYDGKTWTPQYRGPGSVFGDIWGFSPTDVFAVLGEDELLHYDGYRWGSVQLDEPYSPYYHSIWGTSSTELFVGGEDGSDGAGVIRHFDGRTLSEMHPPPGVDGPVDDLSGKSSTDFYALAHEWSPYDSDETYYVSLVLHYDGSRWTQSFQTINYLSTDGGSLDYTITGIWAIAQNDVFVVGSLGHIVHFDGRGWSTMVSPTAEPLLDIWARSGSDVYAVGQAGILHYDGTRWRVIHPVSGSRIWGTSTELFVLTKDVILYGTR